MTHEDDMTIREAARSVCAEWAGEHGHTFEPSEYLSGERDYTNWMRLVEQGIRKGIEIGRSL